jgi:hypothetical protein
MSFHLFYKLGYKMKESNSSSDSCLTFFRPGYETEFFEIKSYGENLQYSVSVPIKNSCFQYKTTFKNYYEALMFLELKFKDYAYD